MFFCGTLDRFFHTMGHNDHGPSLTPLAHSGFSYVDLVEGLHDGHFYALKRILCHEQQDQEEAQREADMHRLFDHPNILHLVAYCVKERGAKLEAWLLLPFFKVRKSPVFGESLPQSPPNGRNRCCRLRWKGRGLPGGAPVEMAGCMQRGKRAAVCGHWEGSKGLTVQGTCVAERDAVE